MVKKRWVRDTTASHVGLEAAATFACVARNCHSQLEYLPARLVIGAQLYLVRSGPQRREERFQELKREHGSVFAFHGSCASNWASILRYGLKNLSGTHHMAHGAAHGQGVYLTPNGELAAFYAKQCPLPHDWSGASDLGKLRIIALCEVAAVPEAGFDISGSGIWVAREDGIVAVRLLLVFPGGEIAGGCAGRIDDIATFVQSKMRLPVHNSIDNSELCLRVASIASVSSNPLMSAKASPPWTPPADSIQITTSEQRFQAASCSRICGCSRTTFFRIEVAKSRDHGLGMKCSDSVWRRYNDFASLHRRLGGGSRTPFPGPETLRTLVGRGSLTGDPLESRRRGLEAWLREVVNVARHGLLREELIPELCAFLGAWAAGDTRQ